MYINNKTGVLAVGGSKDNGTYKEIGSKQTPVLEFSLAVGKNEQGNTIWFNCKAWNPIANRFKDGIVRGEKYLVTGGWEKREHNGNDYYTLVVDGMINMSGLAMLSATSNTFSTLADSVANKDDDDDLPF